jgi:protein-L-isoaspartate(D-aspartate) O-methyltransferase
MAWRSTGSTNAKLVENLYRHGLIKSDRVKNAMLGVRSSISTPRSRLNPPQVRYY